MINQNPEEIQTICHLVRRYAQARREFCVITPYDAQRAAIERQLKVENLPHDVIFNVDSFQGNEADYVLVSVVRTDAPGFLRSLNRMNVMLTRAKKGMVIVTSSAFLRSHGAQTLLGRLARYWETRQQDIWIDWRRVADGTADLPGLPGSLSFVKLSWQTPPAHARAFPRSANDTLAVSSSTTVACDPEAPENRGNAAITESHFPPLPTSTAAQRARVRSEHAFNIKLKISKPTPNAWTSGRGSQMLTSTKWGPEIFNSKSQSQYQPPRLAPNGPSTAHQ
ncbi:AAA domain-containing protein [Mycena sanguinolenta]|nr:AAA domain-containing protein [Mycena sanguinolenta]